MQSLRQTGLYKLTATRHHLDHLKHRHEDTRLLMHLIYDLRVNHHHRVFRWPPLLNNDVLVKITQKRPIELQLRVLQLTGFRSHCLPYHNMHVSSLSMHLVLTTHCQFACVAIARESADGRFN